MSTVQDFSDIDRWSQQYTPHQGGFEPGPEVLPEGLYDFEITGATLKKTDKTSETIFELGVRVLGGPCAGIGFQRPSFFRSQENLDRLGGDMVLLGLDANQWGKRGKPWSA